MNAKETIRRFIVWVITLEARAVLSKYRPNIAIITGSVGKTSTKDALYAALSERFFVRRSEKSYNSDIGVPLTILGVPNGWSSPLRWVRNIFAGLILILIKAPYPKWLLVEVGADRPGDISRSLSWLSPHVVVATRFPDVPVHVEFYSSPGEVVREELTPVSWLRSGGALAANADDEKAASVETPANVRAASYGFKKSAAVRGSRFRITAKNHMPTGTSFDVSYGGEHAHLALPGLIGKSHAYAVLGGIAGAVLLGVPFSDAARAASRYASPPGRIRLIEGINDSVIIDDSYNASPVATEEALDTLSHVPRRGRRIAVLADMLELGSFSASEHRRVGSIAAASTDMLVTVGVRGRGIAEGAREAGMSPEAIHEFEKGEDAALFLSREIQEGDVVLIKGSQSMRMERVTKSLMAEPDKAHGLLPRQDDDWLSR